MLDISKCFFDDSWNESWYENRYYVQVYYFVYTDFYSNGMFDKYKDDPDITNMELKLEVFVEDCKLTSNLSMAVSRWTEDGCSDEDWTDLVPGRDYDDIFLAQLFKLATEGPLDHLAGAYRQNLKRIQEQIKEINDGLKKYC